MKVKKESTMSWNAAPDVIGVEELMAILGIGKTYANQIFNSKGFPKIQADGSMLKADKEAARLFIQGFKIKDNPKETINYMIFLQLKKLNEQIEKRGGIENEKVELQTEV